MPIWLTQILLYDDVVSIITESHTLDLVIKKVKVQYELQVSKTDDLKLNGTDKTILSGLYKWAEDNANAPTLSLATQWNKCVNLSNTMRLVSNLIQVSF